MDFAADLKAKQAAYQMRKGAPIGPSDRTALFESHVREYAVQLAKQLRESPSQGPLGPGGLDVLSPTAGPSSLRVSTDGRITAGPGNGNLLDDEGEGSASVPSVNNASPKSQLSLAETPGSPSRKARLERYREERAKAMLTASRPGEMALRRMMREGGYSGTAEEDHFRELLSRGRSLSQQRVGSGGSTTVVGSALRRLSPPSLRAPSRGTAPARSPNPLDQFAAALKDDRAPIKALGFGKPYSAARGNSGATGKPANSGTGSINIVLCTIL